MKNFKDFYRPKKISVDNEKVNRKVRRMTKDMLRAPLELDDEEFDQVEQFRTNRYLKPDHEV